MKKLYKVTSSTTTMFIADVGGAIEAAQDLMLREEARSAVRREEESLSAALEITEVKSLDDLPPGWHGHELVWEWDEKAVTAMTAIKWFNGRSERERIKSLEEEVERLKEQLNNLGSGSIKSFG